MIRQMEIPLTHYIDSGQEPPGQGDFITVNDEEALVRRVNIMSRMGREGLSVYLLLEPKRETKYVGEVRLPEDVERMAKKQLEELAR